MIRAFLIGVALAVALATISALPAIGVVVLGLLVFHPLASLLVIGVLIVIGVRSSRRRPKSYVVTQSRILTTGRHQRRGWHR
jgi:hypothetical protein